MTTPLPPVHRTRVEQILAAMRATRIGVIGDVMLDRYLLGDADRISPEAPVPVVTVEDERLAPGGAANVAANIVAAGARPQLTGVVGDDDAGRSLIQAIQALGVPVNRLVTIAGRPTTSKTRIVARGQQVVRLDREVTNPLPARQREALLASAHAVLAECDVLLIEDYDKGAIDAAMAGELVAAGRARGIPVVVDPKIRNFFAYSGATVFKPNRRELETALNTHFSGDDADLEDARQRLGTEHLLLTLGAEGVALVSPSHPLRRAASVARDVFDVSGAGDTVAAWTALGLAAGATVAESVWLANVAAGVEVGKLGTATVSAAEILGALDELEGA
ncbi:MAG TPA: PfkB family carbohydrate kinase [Gemmatimonadales bacterium]|jgi:D-beta-D-heptose 7-phosphate kinase/D-beta-D-heptose 1-phosphate adenosyltransferase